MSQGVKIIYADPAWRFTVYSRDTGLGRSADSHYQTMTLEEIKSLDVESISDPDSFCFMWAPMPMIPEALEVMRAWGFKYKTVAFVWVKLKKHWRKSYLAIDLLGRFSSCIPGEIFDRLFFFGMGFWTRANVEIVLLGTRGRVKRISASVRQLVISQIREHSRKPDEVRDRIVDLVGDIPRLEMFARTKSPGWLSWGNEVTSDLEIGVKDEQTK